jgi:hypothetical protein
MNKTVKQHGYKSVFFDLIITCAFLFVFAELIISIYGRTHDVSETSFFFHTNAG